jgi:hypothetical protein
MLQMLLTLLGIDDLHGLVSTGQTFPDEGKQYAILFVVVRKPFANVAYFTEGRARPEKLAAEVA